MQNHSLLDIQQIGQLVTGMEDMAVEIIADLCESLDHDMQRQINAMYNAVEQNNGEALRQAAHALKGSCANMGAVRAASICVELEGVGKQGQTRFAGSMIKQLEGVCQDSLVALRELRF